MPGPTGQLLCVLRTTFTDEHAVWGGQTDGWLSEHSAKVYELSTETLFVGRQDAMQRQTLVPLSQHLRGLAANAGPPSVLEVACGTGRFATFLKVRAPAHFDVFACLRLLCCAT